MAEQFGELSAITQFELYPRAMRDLFFKGAPFLAYMRAERMVPFGGGIGMRSAFSFAPLIGAFYQAGENFNLLRVPGIDATQFKPRYLYVAIPEYKETLQVENVGENALISILDTDVRRGINTANAITAIALYREGQSAARAKAPNGLSEMFGNGTDPSWDGTIATTYGGVTRGGTVGRALNSTPLWVGDSEGNTGTIQYHHLLESYKDASVGSEEPRLGLGNKAVWSFILERMQTQQRFVERFDSDPYYGATGFRFMKAMIMQDEYAPSSDYGESHAILGSNLTGTFTTPNPPTAKSKLPTNKTATVGEVFFWLNPETFALRVARSEEYQFNISGWFPSQRNTRVVAHIKAGFNLQGFAPGRNKQIYGIGG